MDARSVRYSFEARALGARRRAVLERRARRAELDAKAEHKVLTISAVRLHNARVQRHAADMCMKVGMEYVPPVNSNLQGHA